ncbi:rhodanese-like domain-containing protein [Paraglaciecola sp. 2405UD69-4]|uniref:rhodanese-like domain-containing protein n=1 Tax=Paraglaciecola sp. 2405UD69-4 TaxID=3391836 RepID=UPI0039C98CFF
MFKQIIFWFISCIGFTAHAASMTEVNQVKVLNEDPSSYFLVDVRTPKEFAEGHVPNAINIPLSELSTSLEKFSNLENKHIVLYCRSGYRAGKASKMLQQHGFNNLYHLEGDMLGWVKSGLPIEK